MFVPLCFRVSYLLRGAIQHFRWAAALILKPAPTHEQVKCFIVLSLVGSETKTGKNGTPRRNGLPEKIHLVTSLLDVDVQAVPPHWPPLAQNLAVEDGEYELSVVPVTSIALVTSRILKVMRLWPI
jgi:antiviral helicase SKI2